MVGDEHAAARRTRRLSGTAVLLLILAGAPPVRSAATSDDRARPHVADLVVVPEADRAAVSYRLAGLPTDEDLERLRSGIELSYRHRVEVVARRSVALWPARVLGRASVEIGAGYDSLTQRYSLRRRIELKGEKQAIEERRESQSVAEMRAWLAEVQGLSVPVRRAGVADERLRVRVHCTIGRRYVLWLFPTRESLAAEWRPGVEGGP